MRRAVVLLVVAAAAGGFALGRITGDEDERARATAEAGDTFVDERVGVRCEAAQEGGAPTLLCREDRFGVAFFAGELFVYRAGEPDAPIFASNR